MVFNSVLSNDDLLAENIYEYLIDIVPGFIFLQLGIAKGIISASLDLIKNYNNLFDSNIIRGHLSKFYYPLFFANAIYTNLIKIFSFLSSHFHKIIK